MRTAPTSARKRGSRHRPVSVNRRKTGSKHHLICDGRGTSLEVIPTAANVSDVTQTLALVDSIPPVAGRPGRPHDAPRLYSATRATTPTPNRREMRKRRILPVISRRGAPNIEGLGQLCYVVEQPFALLHHSQTTRRPMATPHQTPRRPRLPRLQPHQLPTAQEGCRSRIEKALMAAMSVGEAGGCPETPSTRPFATHPSRAPDDPGRAARCR
ncbi:transposase [Streptomyces sp. NPDC005329]|uniref:transposase n=1 Tax=Streptomyces sp. NPDC005329 TaxID=3157034 RepID=UPI0033A82CEF